ncbi:hypothetical protein Patl1_30185 [Pistacia atlantica]|uniref:Uncharacterized protein n=1 Tax=Pistacia atlantica TaxID=434234 RepID=A0ACC1ADG7_9ROSI|nr:hypothetical protein Patl1_30185 [Pistacia atlantica]
MTFHHLSRIVYPPNQLQLCRNTCLIWLISSLMYSSMLAVSRLYVFAGILKPLHCLVVEFNHYIDVVRATPENRKAPSKENKHRALDDIRESITELKYYKENIFRSKSKK